MKTRILVLVVICLAILSVIQVSADNLAADLGTGTTNPTGNWSIGSVRYGSYFVVHDGAIAGPPINWWYSTSGWSPYGYAGKNVDSIASPNTTDGYVEPGQFVLYGCYSSVSNPTTVQWTAPASGTYYINARYTGQTPSGDGSWASIQKVPVLGSKEILSAGPIQGFIGTSANSFADGTGVNRALEYKSKLALQAGDILWFSCYGSTSLLGNGRPVGLSLDVSPTTPSDNLATSFTKGGSNPSGNWSLGCETYGGTYWTLFDNVIPPSGADKINYWNKGWGDMGLVVKNVGGGNGWDYSAINTATEYLGSGQMGIYGSWAFSWTTGGAPLTVVKWTAPSTGYFNVKATYSGLSKVPGNSLVYASKRPLDGSPEGLLNTLSSTWAYIGGFIGTAELNYTDANDGIAGTVRSSDYDTIVSMNAGDILWFECRSSDESGQKLVGISVDITPSSGPVYPKVAYSDDITVDGDLSEWATADWKLFDKVYDGTPTDIDTGSAWAIKWGAGGSKLYIAVKVKDTSHFLTDEYTDSSARDAVELYIHTTGTDTGPYGTNDYMDYQEQAQEWSMGIMNSNLNSVWANIGYPPSAPYLLSFEEFLGNGKVDGQWLYYEAAITPYEYFGGIRGNDSIISYLTSGDIIGADVVAVGHDLTSYTGMKSSGHNEGGWYGDYNLFAKQQLVRTGVMGAVTLGNFDGLKVGIAGTATITDGTNAEIHNIVLDASGSFSFDTALRGECTVIMKCSHWLGKAETVTVDVDGTGSVNFIFINGDVVDNNEVDFDDINAVRAAYGSFPGDENWNERADVDGTGEVDFTDINIVRSKYGEIGD